MSVANPSLRQYFILNPKLYIFYSLLGLQTEASYRNYSKQQSRWDSGPEGPALKASCLKEPYPLSDAAVKFALSCGLGEGLFYAPVSYIYGIREPHLSLHKIPRLEVHSKIPSAEP